MRKRLDPMKNSYDDVAKILRSGESGPRSDV